MRHCLAARFALVATASCGSYPTMTGPGDAVVAPVTIVVVVAVGGGDSRSVTYGTQTELSTLGSGPCSRVE